MCPTGFQNSVSPHTQAGKTVEWWASKASKNWNGRNDISHDTIMIILNALMII
jgi:hypothetical protein